LISRGNVVLGALQQRSQFYHISVQLLENAPMRALVVMNLMSMDVQLALANQPNVRMRDAQPCLNVTSLFTMRVNVANVAHHNSDTRLALALLDISTRLVLN
jgi:hypothetical protein